MNCNLPAKIMLQAYVLVQLNSPKSKMREAFIMVWRAGRNLLRNASVVNAWINWIYLAIGTTASHNTN